jgi:hypothetical protein
MKDAHDFASEGHANHILHGQRGPDGTACLEKLPVHGWNGLESGLKLILSENNARPERWSQLQPIVP